MDDCHSEGSAPTSFLLDGVVESRGSGKAGPKLSLTKRDLQLLMVPPVTERPRGYAGGGEGKKGHTEEDETGDATPDEYDEEMDALQCDPVLRMAHDRLQQSKVRSVRHYSFFL